MKKTAKEDFDIVAFFETEGKFEDLPLLSQNGARRAPVETLRSHHSLIDVHIKSSKRQTYREKQRARSLFFDNKDFELASSPNLFGLLDHTAFEIGSYTPGPDLVKEAFSRLHLNDERAEYSEIQPSEECDEKLGASNFTIVIQLTVLNLGAGVLSLPWAAAGSGIIPTIVIAIASFGLIFWACDVTVRAADELACDDIVELMGFVDPKIAPTLEKIMFGAVAFSNGLCLIGYILMVSDFLIPIFGEDYRMLYILLAALCCLPLCMLDDLSKLDFTGLICIFANIYILFLMTYNDFTLPNKPTCMVGVGVGWLTCLNCMVQSAVGLQNCAVCVYQSMRHRNIRNWRKCLAMSFVLVLLLFAGYFIPGYQTYGAPVSSNIINNLPDTWPYMIARVLLAIAMIGVYPVVAQPLLQPFRKGLFCRDQPCVKDIVPFLLVGASALGALNFDSLGILNSINGAFSLGCFVGFIPMILGITFLPSIRRCEAFSFFALCIVLSISGLIYGDDNFIQTLDCFWET